MKCSNCGTELKEGTRFCAVCGQPAAEQQTAPVQETVFQSEEMQSATAPHLEDKPKKSKGFKIAIVAIIVAALAVGVVAGAKVARLVKKAMMSPAEYYRYVETKNRDEDSDAVAGYYDAFRKSFAKESYSKNVNMKLDISDTAKSLLSLTGVDCSEFKGIEVDIATGKEKQAYSNLVKILSDDQALITVKSYMDLEAKKSYIQVPELSDAYVDGSSTMDDMADSTNAHALLSLYDFNKSLPKTEDLETIYKRYTDIVIENAKNVKKSEGGCEAEGVSQKADKYTITMNGKDIAKLLEELLNQLKDDKELTGILKNISDEVYESYAGEIQEAIDGLNPSEVKEEDMTVVMEAQITSDEKVIGRTIEVKTAEDDVKVAILCPQDGEKFGFEMTITVNGTEYVKLHGKGTNKSNVINGEFTLGLDESLNEDSSIASLDKVLIVTLKDYDLTGLKDGKFSGIVTYSTEAVADLANYSLRVESKGDMENATSKICVLAGKEEFLTIDMVMESDVKMEEVKPSDSDTIYDASSEEDMQAYQSGIDTMQFMQDLQDKLGIDLSGLLYGGMLGGDTSSLEDYDSDIDYDSLEDYGDVTVGEDDSILEEDY